VDDTVRVEEPLPPLERTTLLGVIDAVNPEGETEDARLTVPAKLLRLAREIVEVPEEPAWKLRLKGLLEMLKSGGTTTLAVSTTECERDPLVPVTVTV
jgi:hypothetical protein